MTQVLDAPHQSKKKRLRPAVFRIAAVGISLVVIALLGEIGTRLFAPKYMWQFRDDRVDWNLDPRLGWVQKPNLDVTTLEETGEAVRFQTNGDGLTPPTAVRAHHERITRIMLVGDSSVVGRAVPQDQALHADLERDLKATGASVEVYNAGVEGYATDQVLLRMEEMIPLYHPDVVLYGFHDNDFGGNADRQCYGLNKPIFRLESDGQLTEVPPEPNKRVYSYGSDPRVWIQYSALYRLLRPRIMVLRAKFGRWQDRNLLGMPQPWYTQPKTIAQVDWKLFIAMLKRMNDCATRNHARFFFYPNPSLAEVWDPYIKKVTGEAEIDPAKYDRLVLQRHLQSAAQEAGVDFCSMADYFIPRQDRGPFHLLPRDQHCNAKGYQLIAERLAAHLQESGYLPVPKHTQK